MNNTKHAKKIARRKQQVKKKQPHRTPFWLLVVETQKHLYGTAPTKEQVEQAFRELFPDE